MPKWLVWVLVGVAGLCVVCGGGCALLGYKGFQMYGDVSESASTYANKAMPAILGTWSSDELLKHAVPGSFGADQAKQMMDSYKTKFGDYQSVGKWTMTGINAATNNGVSKTDATINAEGKFSKSVGTIILKLERAGEEEWKIKEMSIN